MNTTRRAVFTCQCRGFALLETLIAFVVLAVGLVALLGFHSESQRNVAESKAQAEAVALGEEKLQELESYLSENEWRLEDDADGVETSVQGLITSYQREWWIDPTTVGTGMPGNAKLAKVTVSWDDRADNAQSVTLSSYIRNTSPPQDAENFLAVTQAITSSGGGGFDWGTGTGTDTNTGNESDDNDNGGNDGNGDGNHSGDEELGVDYYITLSGSVDATDGDLENVTVTSAGGSFAATWSCSYSNQYYSCDSSPIPENLNWSGEIEFTSDKWFCLSGTNSRGTLTKSYSNISSNQQYNIRINKNDNSCG